MRTVRPQQADKDTKRSADVGGEEEEVLLPRDNAESESPDREVDKPRAVKPLEERIRNAAKFYRKSDECDDGLGQDGGPDRDQPGDVDAEDSPEVIVVEEEEERGQRGPKW